MENQGWIKLHRKSLKSSVFKNPDIWFIWCWCLMKANHESNKFPFNKKDIEIKPGQFITGRSSALLELNPKKRPAGITPRKYRTALNYLKTTNRITIETTNKFSIISIPKWKEYQAETTNKKTNHQTSKRPASDQQATSKTTTNKKEKNEKNEKNLSVSKTDEEKFSFKEKLEEIKKDRNRHIQIIGLYWEYKDFSFENKEQYQAALKRELRSAKTLIGYQDDEIIVVMDWLCDNVNFAWKLETVHKFIDEDLDNIEWNNKKNNY